MTKPLVDGQKILLESKLEDFVGGDYVDGKRVRKTRIKVGGGGDENKELTCRRCVQYEPSLSSISSSNSCGDRRCRGRRDCN